MALSPTTLDPPVEGQQVFETTEWSWLIIRRSRVGKRDRAVLERLKRRRATSAVEYHEVEGDLRLRVGGAVGVLDLDVGRVIVKPKFLDEVQLLRLVQVVSGLRHLDLFAGTPLLAEGRSLPDLLAELLVQEVRRLLRGGLRAGYVTQERHLRALRGRLLADRQQMQAFGLIDRLICRFDELDYDILDNQLLIDGLDAARKAAQDARLRLRAAELQAELLELAAPANAMARLGPPDEIKHELVYDRLNDHYRLPHELCLRLIEGSALNDDISPGQAPTRAFLIETAPLFERFVETVVRWALPDWHVSRQAPAVLYRRLASGKTYTALRPDFIATCGGMRLPLDAKYKPYSLTDAGRKVSSADLNQIYAYSQALATPGSALPRVAVLIYPTLEAGPPSGLTLLANAQDSALTPPTRLVLIGVHVPTALGQLETSSGAQSDLRSLLLRQLSV